MFHFATSVCAENREGKNEQDNLGLLWMWRRLRSEKEDEDDYAVEGGAADHRSSFQDEVGPQPEISPEERRRRWGWRIWP